MIILFYLLIVNAILFMYCMEQRIDDSMYTLPFYNYLKYMPINGIDEISSLAAQSGSGPLYRNEPESNKEQLQLVYNNSFKGKNNDEKANNDEKENDDTIINPNITIPFGAMPFKPSIYCGIGYEALKTVIFDFLFTYHTVLDQHQKKNKFTKVCELNNLVNIYYIITMLNKVSAEYINGRVWQLRTDYMVPILYKKKITSQTYSEKNASTHIDIKETNELIEFVKSIDQLIANEKHKGLCAYAPLKQHQADNLLQLLLQMYVFWNKSNPLEIKDQFIKNSTEYMTLFLETTQAKSNVKNDEENTGQKLLTVFNKFIEQIELLHHNKHVDIEYEKCLILNTFLYTLNQYVYDLIVVPLANVKNNRTLNNQSSSGKRKKNINADSFFVKHAQIISNAKNAMFIVLIIGLLYRIAKNNNKHWTI